MGLRKQVLEHVSQEVFLNLLKSVHSVKFQSLLIFHHKNGLKIRLGNAIVLAIGMKEASITEAESVVGVFEQVSNLCCSC